MSGEINLGAMATEALRTFPPLDGDIGAASNFAQRMLTKKLSEKRKSGEDIPESTEQALRLDLDTELNRIDVPAPALEEAQQEVQTHAHPRLPEKEHLTSIISNCFHTSSDGSPEHVSHLGKTAMRGVTDYLNATGVGWIERRPFTKYAKKLIQDLTEEMKHRP